MKISCLLFGFVLGLTISAGALAQCLTGWSYWRKRCYWVEQTAYNFTQAAANCGALGTRLAVPNSAEEHDFIVGVIQMNPASWLNFLGCAVDLTTNPQDWHCNDGSFLGQHDLVNQRYQQGMSHFWSPSNVRNAMDSTLMVFRGLWFDSNPSSTRGSVCEYTLETKVNSASYYSTRKNTRVIFPAPYAIMTGIWSRVLCLSECLDHVFCIAVNFDANTGTCHVYQESLWVIQYNRTAGWELVEV